MPASRYPPLPEFVHGALAQSAQNADCGFPRAKLVQIIRRTREHGASEGWSAFRTDQHIYGLGPAFGTKLLYFAGYRHPPRPRPLVLDENVMRALNSPEIGLPAKIRYRPLHAGQRAEKNIS